MLLFFMGVDVAEKVEFVLPEITEPKFRDASTLTHEQLTDPDYRLKQLQKDANKYNLNVTCSRCHHCR